MKHETCELLKMFYFETPHSKAQKVIYLETIHSDPTAFDKKQWTARGGFSLCEYALQCVLDSEHC